MEHIIKMLTSRIVKKKKEVETLENITSKIPVEFAIKLATAIDIEIANIKELEYSLIFLKGIHKKL